MSVTQLRLPISQECSGQLQNSRLPLTHHSAGQTIKRHKREMAERSNNIRNKLFSCWKKENRTKKWDSNNNISAVKVKT